MEKLSILWISWSFAPMVVLVAYVFLKLGYRMGKGESLPVARVKKQKVEEGEYPDPWTEAQEGIDSERINTL